MAINLHLNFRKIKSSEAIKEHLEKRVAKFEKFVTYPMEVRAFLSVEKSYQTAELTCHAEHKEIVGIAKAKDMYEAIDMVCHKVEAQLKKEREKKKGHNSAHLAIRPNSLKLAQDVKAVVPHREKKTTTEVG